jgi:hypothetical protein
MNMKLREEKEYSKECNGILAWHFLRDDRKFGYGDGNKAVTGQIFYVDPPIEMCRWGLHGSEKIRDALSYAPGSQIGRVILSGESIKGDSKIVATQREYLWIVDATNLLHEFACDIAEKALNDRKAKGHQIDSRSTNVIQVKRKWLLGLATGQELAAARDAAMDAAWYASRAAAWDVAWDVAWAAAWDVARDWQNKELEKRVRKLL